MYKRQQQNIAAESGIAFWNMFEAMGGEGSTTYPKGKPDGEYSMSVTVLFSQLSDGELASR